MALASRVERSSGAVTLPTLRQERRRIRQTGRALLLRLAHDIALITPAALWLAFPLLGRSALHDVWWSGAYNAALLGLTSLAAYVTIRRRRFSLGVAAKATGWVSHLAWGLGGFFTACTLRSFANLLHQPLATQFAYVPSLAGDAHVPLDWTRVALTFARGPVVAPICEELTFRGGLLSALSTLFARPWVKLPFAIAVSSVIFAAGHGYGVRVGRIWLQWRVFKHCSCITLGR